ncbi:type 1 glutamine amidotransferase [Aminobacter sp. SR38]|jgi:GMP synthase-like glutamine amidotransferase|uniref:type 1 glutamine amidotransferase n=1 Tax=Aminobacter TaxID=31988 RepID=UPI00177C94A0|nr:type 1 glutamine amidotransferase [Aminobacter sp. SR38]QOF69812.1 type 1 glutamine amidotransferase [Aminobacter sp. SR38]
MKILVFQHLRVEHSGIFAEFWREAGHSEHIVELGEGEAMPDLDGFDVLAAMGGPMDVWQEDAHPWLKPEKAAIRRWVRELGRPYLGICLGHQLLADALGGKVGLMKAPEVGLATVELTKTGRSDRLFSGVDPAIETLQWHGAEVSGLPLGGEVLAANAACPIQAMRVGHKAYGFQYHMEITERTVDDWSQIPEYAASLKQALGPEEAQRLAQTVAPHLPVFRATARRINDNFFAAIGR